MDVELALLIRTLSCQADGIPQVRLVAVASPGVDAKGDVPGSELVEVENRDMVFLPEHDAKHPAFVRVAEDQNVKGCAADTVSVMLYVLDVKFHGVLLPWLMW